MTQAEIKNLISKGITDLVNNGDLVEQTTHDRIVNYLYKVICTE